MWTSTQYRPENLLETIDMTREYYGSSWISDSDFLRWQYEANPAGPAVIHLARDVKTHQLAGQNVVIPMRFKTKDRPSDQPIKGTLCLNILTRKAYHGQGIFTGLAEPVYQDCVEQGLEFCYAFPNPNSYPGFIRKLGFTDLGSVPLLLRPLDPKALVQQKVWSLLAPLALPFQLYYRVKDRSDDRYEVYPLTAFDLPEMNAFWAKIQHKYPIMGIRDADYMRWRYFDIPLRKYKLYGVRQKNSSTLLGYIVGRCTEVSDMTSGMIVDFLINPSHPDAGSLLVNHLLRFFVEQDMSLAGSLLLPHTEESRILKSHGFFTCPKFIEPQPFRVIYRRFSPLKSKSKETVNETSNEGTIKDDPFLQLNQWFLTMGDYDVI